MEFLLRTRHVSTLKTLLVSSNANNSTQASLSTFNSNNVVSNANTNVSLLYI